MAPRTSCPPIWPSRYEPPLLKAGEAPEKPWRKPGFDALSLGHGSSNCRTADSLSEHSCSTGARSRSRFKLQPHLSGPPKPEPTPVAPPPPRRQVPAIPSPGETRHTSDCYIPPTLAHRHPDLAEPASPGPAGKELGSQAWARRRAGQPDGGQADLRRRAQGAPRGREICCVPTPSPPPPRRRPASAGGWEEGRHVSQGGPRRRGLAAGGGLCLACAGGQGQGPGLGACC